jgi:hypothetical protein
MQSMLWPVRTTRNVNTLCALQTAAHTVTARFNVCAPIASAASAGGTIVGDDDTASFRPSGRLRTFVVC